MIETFGSKVAEHIFHGIHSKHSQKLHQNYHAKVIRLLDQIHAVTEVKTLQIPPSNHLEKLSGNYKDYWSIRINQQWRVIFKWIDGNAYDVDIVDYH